MKKTSNYNRPAPVLLILSLALAGSCPARTFRVSEGESIQEALDAAAASPGADIVLLAPGTYHEFFEIADSDPVTLNGTGAVTINGGDEDEDVIKIDGGHVTLRNLTVTGGDDGIDAGGNDDGGSLVLVNVTASGNADEGLEAGDMDSLSVTNSTFSDNGGDGVSAEAVQSVVIANVASSANDDGYDFEEVGSVRMYNVTGDRNEDEGLEVDDAGLVEVVHGSFELNSDEGIDIDNTEEILLLSVDSIANGGSGFQCEADGVVAQQITVTGGLFAGNGEDGIQFREDSTTIASATLTAVRCQNNLDSGLDLEITGTLRMQAVSSGTAEGNGAPDQLP